jgi:hypothetical protein
VRRVLGIALALALASSARAGDAASDQARLEARLGPDVGRQVGALVDDARAAGLPTDPLIARAFEGASRGADAAGIVNGVRRQSGAQLAARGALGAGSQPDEIVAGASALLAGVPADSLARLRLARPGGNLVIPLVVLCDLVARGVPADAASVAVVTAARAGATDGALLRIRERIHSGIENGGAPAGTAGDVVRQWLHESPGGKASKQQQRGREPEPQRKKAP